MLLSLLVENFRSIRKASLTFRPLTIIIGANGSGKSNVIKAIQFVSEITTSGLGAAVARQGGRHSLLPKAIPTRNVTASEAALSYRVDVGLPNGYSPSLPRPLVQHDLAFGWPGLERLEVRRESLKFFEPLAVAEALNRDAPDSTPQEATPPPATPSSIEFRRHGAGVLVEPQPPFDALNVDLYLSWLGLAFLRNISPSIDQEPRHLHGVLERFMDADRAPAKLKPHVTLPEITPPTPYGFSAHFQQFRSWATTVRHFDFQLAVLRREQDVDPAHALTAEGGHLPAALRWLREEEGERERWARIQETLSAIAPHVRDTHVRPLKTGKEYLRFLETRLGRPVESWDQSDGTLRALAILVAVETSPKQGTVLIEEPEVGLHPWAVETLLAHVRDAVQRRTLQVVLTTHSQQVLDQAVPDEVLVATRVGETGTEIRDVRTIAPGLGDEPGALGRKWVKGLLGGVPSGSE